MIRAYGWPRKRSVIVLSMSLISRSRLSSLRASRLISSAVPASPGSATSCWSASVTAVAAILVIPAGQAWFSTRWAVTPQQNSHIVPRPHPVCAGPDHGQDRSSSLRCGRSVLTDGPHPALPAQRPRRTKTTPRTVLTEPHPFRDDYFPTYRLCPAVRV